jgi:UDP-glucuronate 4-epimerase
MRLPGLPLYNVFNIGNSSPVPLMDFIHTMEEAFGKKAVLEMLPMQQGDVMTTYADTSKLENIIHYRPAIPLSQGLRHFADWYVDKFDIKI